MWTLDRWTFRKILTTVSDARLREYEQFLRGVQSFQVLLDYERAKIAEALEEVSFTSGAQIVKQGQLQAVRDSTREFARACSQRIWAIHALPNGAKHLTRII